jgi:hypothetical protein
MFVLCNNSISLIAMSITDYRRTTHSVANRPEGMGATRHCPGHNYFMLITATYSYFPYRCKQVYKLEAATNSMNYHSLVHLLLHAIQYLYRKGSPPPLNQRCG